ncbi:MAG: hypothetical protein KBT08_08170 [Bacteroidales bacterium]|nr:hypothetical protein [Candidatus Cryptobacteroides onthequi]
MLGPPRPQLRECLFAGEEELRNTRFRGNPSTALGGIDGSRDMTAAYLVISRLKT